MIPKSTKYFHQHRDDLAFMACRARLRKEHQERCKTDPRIQLLVRLSAMKDRCVNPRNKAFRAYGGRGIRVCDQWKSDKESFVSWALSNGWQRNLEIDRIDVNGDYSPENCRFIPKIDNARNTRRAQLNMQMADEIRALFAFGAKASDVAETYGVSRHAVYGVKYGRSWQ